MADKDLGESLENMEEGIEKLKNKEFRILGFKVTFMSVSALAAVLGSVIGALYFGFTMYQKIEEVANLDALQNDYDNKSNQLRDSNQTRMDDLEAKVERDLKDVEDRLNSKLQRALDNPLAN
jgi:hypothetical protein